MESRAFIRQAAVLMERIKFMDITTDTDHQEQRKEVQKELNQAFLGLQNPTLPSAYKLRDAALAAGYTVSHQVQQRLAQFENLVP